MNMYLVLFSIARLRDGVERPSRERGATLVARNESRNKSGYRQSVKATRQTISRFSSPIIVPAFPRDLCSGTTRARFRGISDASRPAGVVVINQTRAFPVKALPVYLPVYPIGKQRKISSLARRSRGVIARPDRVSIFPRINRSTTWSPEPFRKPRYLIEPVLASRTIIHCAAALSSRYRRRVSRTPRSAMRINPSSYGFFRNRRPREALPCFVINRTSIESFLRSVQFLKVESPNIRRISGFEYLIIREFEYFRTSTSTFDFDLAEKGGFHVPRIRLRCQSHSRRYFC